MVWYADGSIEVEANGQVATGTGTAFLKNVRIGDGLNIAGSASMHEVTNIASDTQLTFSPPFTGAAGAGKQYRIAPIQGYVKEAADRLREVLREVGPLIMSEALQALADAKTDQERRAVVSLGKVDNTADVDKPLSTAASQAIEKKADKTALGNASTRTVTANYRDSTAGRLLKVGDFGLGSPLNLTAPDLNTIRDPGLYYCNSPTNGPGNNGYLLVEAAASDYVKQTYTSVGSGSNDTYVRQIFNNVARPWEKLARKNEVIGASIGTLAGGINRVFLDVPGVTDTELRTNGSYAGALEIREVNQVAQSKSGSSDYAPGITLHYGGYAVNKLWMSTGANLFWGGSRILIDSDISSVANANGSYIKYPDGTMEVWGTFSFSGGPTNTLTNVTFPAAFVGFVNNLNPNISLTVTANFPLNDNNWTIQRLSAYVVSNTQFGLERVWSPQQSAILTFRATGRWK